MADRPEPLLDQLKPLAVAAATHAYCPYSRFQVGAVLTTTDGRTFSGCNVENSSYGLACCAERTAIFKAVSEGVGVGEIDNVLVYTPGQRLYTPCGACRQILAELAPGCRIYSTCDSDEMLSSTIDESLPRPFLL